MFWFTKSVKFHFWGVQNRETWNRRLGTIGTSFQDFKILEKQISPTFYFPINNTLLYHFLANWLAHNKKMTERNLFFASLGVLNWRHNRSQSPVFGVAVLYPTGSEIWRLWHIKTRGRKIAIEKISLLHLSSTLGRFNRANKKRSVIYTLMIVPICITGLK